MDRVELMRSHLRQMITKIEYIRHKLQHVSRFNEFTEMKLFDHHLEKTKKYYENALTTPSGWQSFDSITKSERLTNSILIGHRLEIFAFEVRFERLAVKYANEFYGFYHPEPFNLFGISEYLIYDKGIISKDVRSKEYDAVRSAIQKDPSLILKEREKVTAYLYRGCETAVFKKSGKSFPIDLTVPGGY